MDAAEIAQYARGAGLSGDAVAISVAIALAESGGNPKAHNPVPPDNSYGLWQINMLGSLGTARRRQFGISSNDELYDPATNARAMYAISGGGKDWTPWTTYTRGAYLAFLGKARAAAGSDVSGATAQNAGLGTDDLENLNKGIKTITDSGTWTRIGLFVAGFILIVIALFAITGDGKLSSGTKKAISLAVTKGKVAWG